MSSTGLPKIKSYEKIVDIIRPVCLVKIDPFIIILEQDCSPSWEYRYSLWILLLNIEIFSLRVSRQASSNSSPFSTQESFRVVIALKERWPRRCL